jgi:hypothetical protein
MVNAVAAVTNLGEPEIMDGYVNHLTDGGGEMAPEEYTRLVTDRVGSGEVRPALRISVQIPDSYHGEWVAPPEVQGFVAIEVGEVGALFGVRPDGQREWLSSYADRVGRVLHCSESTRLDGLRIDGLRIGAPSAERG